MEIIGVSPSIDDETVAFNEKILLEPGAYSIGLKTAIQVFIDDPIFDIPPYAEARFELTPLEEVPIPEPAGLSLAAAGLALVLSVTRSVTQVR